MPIEFACPHCGRRLRTPDDSAGKRAKCPSCQQVAQVPAAAQQSELPEDELRQAATPGSGLPRTASSPSDFSPSPLGSGAASSSAAGGYSPAGGAGGPLEFNPYAAPETDTSAPPDHTSRFLITPRQRLDFNEVLSATWRVFLKYPLQCLGFSILMIVVSIAVNIFASILASLLVSLGAGNNGDGGVIAGLISGGISILVGCITTLLTINFGLNCAMGRNAFEGLGRNSGRLGRLLAVMIAMFVPSFILVLLAVVVGAVGGVGVIVVGLSMLVGGILVAYFVLSYIMAPYLIMDHNLGVMDSLRESKSLMTGNRLMLMGIMFATGLLSMIGVLLTLGLGYLVLPGIVSILYALMYGQLAGARYASSRS